MENKNQLGSLDHFRLIAAFLVAAIHTSPLASFSSGVDFVFTRVLARMAVPFFLMVTGFFLLPQYLFEDTKDYRPLMRFLKKTLLLYMVAIFLYLPINLYAGHLKGLGFDGILRLLLFDGTFYHLWYLPASVLGVLLITVLSRYFSFRIIAGFSLLLYGLGLLGDSYYGFITDIPLLRSLYDVIFRITSYTRNGLLYAPLFLIMGAWIQHFPRPQENLKHWISLAISVIAMVGEGLLLHHLEVQRHDSMYILLPVCMCFLFLQLLSIKTSPVKYLRTLSTWIYLIHPWMIVLVRGAAKHLCLENLLVNNSLGHYIAVCIGSFLSAWAFTKISSAIRRKPFLTDRAWIELDTANLEHNMQALKKLLPPGCQFMPAVKANAYGHGAVLISKELNRLGIRAFCVAAVTEGIELRRNGIKGDILILGYTHPEQFPLLRKYHLIQTVLDYSYAELLNAYGKKIKVHIKIDTGMHRLGERSDRIEEICDIFKLRNLVITGAYTHLCADESRKDPDYSFTQSQAASFYHVTDELKRRGHDVGKLHLLASYGLINYPELGGDYARIGIALYGVLSSRTDLENCPIPLKPVLSIKARISLTKNLHVGEAAGYGLQYIAKEEKMIAVLSIGYADGIPRSLSCCHGKVLINGEAAPIIGRICMDQMLVDVTDIPNVKSGDSAILIGRSGTAEISVYDLAEASGTITNEILSRLGSRLSRNIK